MKALVGAFNQEKALVGAPVGAFSVIVQLHRWIVSQHYLFWFHGNVGWLGNTQHTAVIIAITKNPNDFSGWIGRS